jgi:hypothetical protein
MNMTTENTENFIGRLWSEESGHTLEDWLKKGGAFWCPMPPPGTKLVAKKIHNDGTFELGALEGAK